jgi:hypothetical protein
MCDATLLIPTVSPSLELRDLRVDNSHKHNTAPEWWEMESQPQGLNVREVSVGEDCC